MIGYQIRLEKKVFHVQNGLGLNFQIGSSERKVRIPSEKRHKRKTQLKR